MQSQLHAWTYLTRCLICALVFDPLRVSLYKVRLTPFLFLCWCLIPFLLFSPLLLFLFFFFFSAPFAQDTINMLLVKLKGDIQELTSVQLKELRMPQLASVNESPALVMRSYQLVLSLFLSLSLSISLSSSFVSHLQLRQLGQNEYEFKLAWEMSSFLLRLELKGKKLGLEFELLLTMKGLQVEGIVKARSPVDNPAKIAISFVEVSPYSLSFF
jgi:hypothetical protein